MRFQDFISTALLTIRRQKTRTALSLIGVVIGSSMLLFSLSSRRGVQDAVANVFSMSKRMRQIEVYMIWGFEEEEIPEEALKIEGDMDEAMRLRIRKMLIRQWQSEHGGERIGLTRERIEKIEAMQHVQRVHPEANIYDAVIIQGEKQLKGRGASAAFDDEVLQERILAGEGFESDGDNKILLNEFVAWRWGYVTKSQMQKLVGTKVRIENRQEADYFASSLSFRSGSDIEFSKEEISNLNNALDRLPTMIDELPLSEQEREVLKKAFPTSDPDSRKTNSEKETKPKKRIIAQEFTVAGVFRGPTEQEIEDRKLIGRDEGFSEFLLPIKTATRYALRTPFNKKTGFYNGTVLVDDESHLKTVSQQIRKMGFREYSLVEFVERIKKRVREVTLIVSLIAIFALVISAIGIANTMVMSVVERTREIGVMKAVGAREAHIKMLFLIEGALLGLIGGVISVVLGFAVRVPIESMAILILESELNKPFEQQHILEFPLWLSALVLAFSMIVTTLATILPAWRAARIDPITALRHD